MTRFLLQPGPCRTTPTRGADQRTPGKPPTRITSHHHPGGSIRHDTSRLSVLPAPSSRPFDLPLGPPVHLSASLRLCGGPEQPELRPACASNLPRSIGVREIPALSPQNPELSPTNGRSSPRRPADVPRISPARVRRSRRRTGKNAGARCGRQGFSEPALTTRLAPGHALPGPLQRDPPRLRTEVRGTPGRHRLPGGRRRVARRRPWAPTRSPDTGSEEGDGASSRRRCDTACPVRPLRTSSTIAGGASLRKEPAVSR